MADYRLYFLNAEGRIQRALPLECETDQQAIDIAAGYPSTHGVELWQLERRVQTFPPRSLEQIQPKRSDRPTSLERAYQLARSGACTSVAEIKLRLRSEGLDEGQVFGPSLLADLRRHCTDARRTQLDGQTSG